MFSYFICTIMFYLSSTINLNSVEKVYLHTDRNSYVAGENIWYKAYLLSDPNHKPSEISKTIYIELVDPDGKQILQSKLYVENGRANGDLKLPPYLETGRYALRAYTQWMRNWDSEYFFHKSIHILSPTDTFPTSISSSEVWSLDFFPEGGDMIEAIPGKIAIKAVNQYGKGKVIEGVIEDDKGNFISQFTTNHLGMGIFYLRPIAGVKYQAKINGLVETFLLPQAKSKGLTLAVDNPQESDKITLRIQSIKNYASVMVIAHVRSQICFSAKVQMSQLGAMLQIPKEVFPPGVAQITILNEENRPLVERLVFVNEPLKLKASISSNKEVFRPREKVGLQIELKDEDGNALEGDFSLSVVDQSGVLLEDSKETIFEYLLLRSELRGHIQDPSYYFDSSNEDRWQALDYLMLTQGWRKFTINELTQVDKKVTSWPWENGLSFSGKLLEYDTEKAVSYGKISMLDMSGSFESWETVADRDGDFAFRDVFLFDTCQLMFKGETRKGGDLVRFKFEEAEKLPLAFPLFPLEPKAALEQKEVITKSQTRNEIELSFNTDMRTIILDEVKIKGQDERREVVGSKIYGVGSVTLEVGDNPLLQNLPHPMMLVVGRVPGVIMQGGRITIRGINSFGSNKGPLILIDDVPVYDSEILGSIPVYDIETVVVWKGPDAAAFGSQGAGGVIGFYTKRGRSTAVESPGVTNFLFKGYHIAREFYAPRYDQTREEHIKPDHRVTLHWEPYVQVDSTGSASLNFYNHDLPSKVLVKLEGITNEGVPVIGEFEYEVNR